MSKYKNIPFIISLLIITILPALAYLILIPFLGFYNDDWLFAYSGHFYGPQGLISSLAGDRPAVGVLFALNYLLFKENILIWHIYMFFIRLLGGYLLFFLLNKIWQNKLSVITPIVLLFLTYPGFLQQPVPLGYQNYITALTLWIASLFFTVHAIKTSNKFLFILFTLISLALQISSYLLVEIFIGMEILRFLIILHQKINYLEIKKKFVTWIPYIMILILFICWRIFLFKSERVITNIGWVSQSYYSNPYWIAKIPFKIIYSFFSTIIFAYFIPIAIRLKNLPLKDSLLSTFVGLTSGASVFFYYKYILNNEYKRGVDRKEDFRKISNSLLSIGIISLFIILIPVILSGRFVSEFSNNDNYDRFTISSIISVGFILTGSLLLKIPKKIRLLAISLLVFISVTTHLMNSYWFSIYWNQQKDIWWQLYWRTPQIKKNALLVFDSAKPIPTIYRNFRLEDYSIWAPGNLFFNYYTLPSNHFSGIYLLNDELIKKLKDKKVESIFQESSTFSYTNNFNNAVIVSLPGNNSCLWVLDKQRQELPNNLSKFTKSSITYSNIDQIVNKGSLPAIPPSQIFGNQPPHKWCYYFQKSSLLRQLEDWDGLYQLTQEVLEKNLKPQDTNEWLPFIEGLIISKKYTQAENLINTISKNESSLFTNNLCHMITRLGNTELKKYCNQKLN